MINDTNMKLLECRVLKLCMDFAYFIIENN